jgi:hypothetical protein
MPPYQDQRHLPSGGRPDGTFSTGAGHCWPGYSFVRFWLLPRNGGATRRPDREADCCPGTAVRPADPIAKLIRCSSRFRCGLGSAHNKLRVSYPLCPCIGQCEAVCTLSGCSLARKQGLHPGTPLTSPTKREFCRGRRKEPFFDLGVSGMRPASICLPQ